MDALNPKENDPKAMHSALKFAANSFFWNNRICV